MVFPQPTRIGMSAATALRIVVPSSLLALCVTILWEKIGAMDSGAIFQAVSQVTWAQWALAGAATWCSFQAIGRYDAMWHQNLKTGVPAPLARRSGIRAIAIAQLLGFGALTGSLVRWYSLPHMSLLQATQVSFAVTIAFTACWAASALLALIWLGGIAQVMPLLSMVVIAAAIARTPWVRRRLGFILNFKEILALFSLTALDLFFAACALYLLIPQGTDLTFLPLLAAYIIALGAGLIANTPGGAGVFELALLAFLPSVSPEPLIAAVIAFRIVYYLVPAILALLALARPAPSPATNPRRVAAWGLARQSGQTARIDGVDLLLGGLPLLLPTVGPQPKPVPVTPFEKQALRQGKIAACYNADPRTALLARKSGWHVRRVAMEAIIQPATWTTAGGHRQTLRRKLKKAERAGVSIDVPQDPCPNQLLPIARAWALSHGGEFGFSMGRFCPSYVVRQRVFVVKCDAQSVGFITFHVTKNDWALDLIRHSENIPDGAIHAAIVTAIEVAKNEGVRQLSLASVPDPRFTPKFWANSRAGLTQFKRSFAPTWAPRYHAAPNSWFFWISGAMIGFAIHRPLANAPWKLAATLKFIMQKYQLGFMRSRLHR